MVRRIEHIYFMEYRLKIDTSLYHVCDFWLKWSQIGTEWFTIKTNRRIGAGTSLTLTKRRISESIFIWELQNKNNSARQRFLSSGRRQDWHSFESWYHSPHLGPLYTQTFLSQDMSLRGLYIIFSHSVWVCLSGVFHFRLTPLWLSIGLGTLLRYKYIICWKQLKDFLLLFRCIHR